MRGRRAHNGMGGAVCEHAPLVQHDHMIIVADLVDQMGRPKDAYSFLGDEASYNLKNPGARLDVEPRGRLVEQQPARLVQGRPSDLDPPHLTAGKEAHLVADPVGETDARELHRPSLARFTPSDAMESAMIGQILRNAEIGVQRALLKHDAKSRKSGAAVTRDVAAENAHHPRSAYIKMRDHREECTLARAVQTQEHGEARGRDVEAPIIQRDPRSIGVRYALHRERADARLQRRVGDHCHCFEIATPQGNEPTGIDLITFSAATSMTDTSLETPLVDKRYLPSGVNSNCQTRWPTSKYLSTCLVAASMTAPRLAGPVATNASLPSALKRMPTGWICSFASPGTSNVIFCLTTCLTGSMTLTVPPTSDVTHSSEPSLLYSA